VAVDWQEPVVLRRYVAYSLPVLTNIGPAAAAIKHTTAPINLTRDAFSCAGCLHAACAGARMSWRP